MRKPDFYEVTLRSFRCACKNLSRNTGSLFTARVCINMASSSADQKRTPTERFEQRAVIKLRANSGMTPTQTW